MLYTIMPLELVLQGQETMEHKYSEIEENGRKLIVEPISLTEAKLVRLISPDPQDYLQPQWQPGRMIQFSPTAINNSK
jgi:hypothetical protein